MAELYIAELQLYFRIRLSKFGFQARHVKINFALVAHASSKIVYSRDKVYICCSGLIIFHCVRYDLMYDAIQIKEK